MEHKVWEILDKSKWTEEGIKHIEQLYDAIERISKVVKPEDLLVLADGLNADLYEVMDILEKFVVREKEEE